MNKLKKKDWASRLAIFKDLDEKQIKTLYSLSTIKKLQPGDLLFKEGAIDQTVYVILSGKIKVEKGDLTNRKQIETFREGDCVGEIAFLSKTPRTTSAIAYETSNVMAIGKDTMNGLEDKTQLFLYKWLNDLVVARINRLEARGKKLTVKNAQLMKDIFDERAHGKADLSNSEIIQNILNKIPRLPVFANSLVGMLIDERTSADALTEKIKNDPSLVGVVMKTVNSSYYGFKQKISDIHRAIVLLGFNEMYQLVIAEGIRQAMPKNVEFQKVQSHCVVISYIASLLSQETHVGKPAEMATIGLLHDLGRVVIQLLEKQNPKLAPFLETLDQAQMGSLLLRSWNLPDVVWKSAKFQSYPEFSPPTTIDAEIRDNVILLYLAHLCLDFFQEHTANGFSKTFLEEHAQLVNLKKFSVPDIARKCVLPGLIKNTKTLPVSLRQLVEKQVDIDQSI